MTFYKHTIPAEKNTKSAHKLEELHEREGLLQVFHPTAIHDYADTWLATFKGAPYSDRDFMLIYSDKNFNPQENSSLLSLGNEKIERLFYILDVYLAGICEKYCDEIDSGKTSVLCGINTGVQPGPHSTQSVHRPHFHVTLPASTQSLSLKVNEQVHMILDNVVLENNITLKRLSFQEHEQYNNHYLNTYDATLKIQALCVQYLKSIGISCKESRVFGFDIPLMKDVNIFQKNATILKKIYQLIWDFLNKNIESTTFIHHFTPSDISSISSEKSNLGFSFTLHNQQGNWSLRVKFFYKQPGYGAGVMESMGHFLDRDYNAPKPVIFDEEFKQKVLSVSKKI